MSGSVCKAHLCLGGLRGKKSTPSVGWEVQRLREDELGYDTLTFILHGRLLLTLHSQFCSFNYVNKVLDLAF
jgi:hypothetical protein